MGEKAEMSGETDYQKLLHAVARSEAFIPSAMEAWKGFNPENDHSS